MKKYMIMIKGETNHIVEVDAVSFKEDNRLFIHKETVSTYSSLKWVLSDKECGVFLCKGRTRKEVIEKYHELKKKYEEIYHKQMHLRLIKEFKELGGHNE